MCSRTVLIVDDEPMIRLILTEALCDEGYQVLEASNVLAAIAAFGQHEVHAVITDVDMPGPLNGFDLARLVAGSGTGTEVLVTSGGVLPNDADLPTGCCFMPKPYRIDDILMFLKAGQGARLAEPMALAG
jgi:DNA-binding NtrC family response regulator